MNHNSQKITLTVDGVEIQGKPGQSILEATEEAGVYVPRLCWMKGLTPAGSCRLCTVRGNGRPQSACTQPIAPGMIVENDTEEMRAPRSGSSVRKRKKSVALSLSRMGMSPWLRRWALVMI